MNERGFWDKIRARITKAGGLAWKLPADTRKGLPDAIDIHEGAVRLLELKYVKRWPARPTTPITIAVTAEQLAHLRAWLQHGGEAYVVLGVAKEEFWLDPTTVVPYHRVTAAALRTAAASSRGIQLPAPGPDPASSSA